MSYEYTYHMDDLGSDVTLKGDLAIDTEAMGLINHRDRLCLVQIADESSDIHLVHFKSKNFSAPNLRKLLSDNDRMKIFHYARFDMAIINEYLKVELSNVFCTKIASKLCRTYTNYHSLFDLCSDLLGQKISKQQQSSDWGAEKLNDKQLDYASQDVKYLHQLRDKLSLMLKREERYEIAKKCFQFLPTKIKLDLLGWIDSDIFLHH
jgi:ribonuclease D